MDEFGVNRKGSLYENINDASNSGAQWFGLDDCLGTLLLILSHLPSLPRPSPKLTFSSFFFWCGFVPSLSGSARIVRVLISYYTMMFMYPVTFFIFLTR